MRKMSATLRATIAILNSTGPSRPGHKNYQPNRRDHITGPREMAGQDHRGNDEDTNDYERENQGEHSFDRPVSVFLITLFQRLVRRQRCHTYWCCVPCGPTSPCFAPPPSAKLAQSLIPNVSQQHDTKEPRQPARPLRLSDKKCREANSPGDNCARDEKSADMRIRVFTNGFLQEEAKIYYATYKEVEQLVGQIATARGYSVVIKISNVEPDPAKPDTVASNLNREVVWAARGMDITPLVMEEISRRMGSADGRNDGRKSRPGLPIRE